MGIQNVKELGINGYETEDARSFRESGFFNNLVYPHQLEKLSFIHCYALLSASVKAFPATLKKLKLERTSLSWSYLDIIAELPNLEVLKLIEDGCCGEEWHPNNCSAKLVASSGRIQEKQESLGSKGVNIRSYNDPGLKTSNVMNRVMGYVYHTSNNIVNDGLGPEKMMMNVDVVEDSDADAAKHDYNYDLNWLFDVQNNLFQVIIAKAYVNIVDMAHASVASLTRTIESLLTSNSPMQSLTCDHREEISDLHEKTSTLEVVVKNFEKNNVCGEMTEFEVEVEEVASAAEHTIQLRVTEVVLAHERLSDTLQLVAQDIDRIWKVSTKIQDKGKQVSEGSLVQDFSSSTNNILNVNNNMVGRDDQKERLLENLTGNYSGEPKVIPIVGMGGIGKTTLAKEVYNHESILRRFDVRAWATVSQQHNIKEILLSLLQSTIKMDDVIKTKGEAELADMLQKSLKRKRYLIVLDDIWSCEVWDGMRRCFPTEDSAGSRILLTTRNNEVARDAGIENLSMQMNFMDQDESWNLFKSAAFSNEVLSSEFETIGKKIAEKCHGLPLTTVVVAGLLKSKGAIEDWESVAKDVMSFITNDPDEQCSHVIGLSYNHLTSDLKTCLLHFGIFLEDSEIPAKNLMRSWMAEGFLKLGNDLEGEAEKCLQELVDRCL
ncbi:hypothetical protein BC332_27130 [Capsicum chinense]|nr:hypothetical protein BC332_27130 [Capsicum chinense]